MIYPHFAESAADVGKDGMALECLSVCLHEGQPTGNDPFRSFGSAKYGHSPALC